MQRTLALIVLVGLPVSIAKPDGKPTPPPSKPSTVAPDQDVRLACLTDAKPQKIGLLTYYPNKGGGYTFMERQNIVFYALPFMPATSQFERIVRILGSPKGEVMPRNLVERTNVSVIGTSQMPVGGQTIYRPEMHAYFNVLVRHDISIGKWFRETSDARFRLFITSDDHETRLKLKSIVPVLENASKRLDSRP
jgi:hypothetical protein